MIIIFVEYKLNELRVNFVDCCACEKSSLLMNERFVFFVSYARLQLFSLSIIIQSIYLNRLKLLSSPILSKQQNAHSTHKHIHFITLLSICLHIIQILCSATDTCIRTFYRFLRPFSSVNPNIEWYKWMHCGNDS